MAPNSLSVRSDKSGSLTQYNAQKGIKKVAFLEMAEKHYAKAKDASKLTEAIRAKLEAQAEFVLWWDTQFEKDKGGRPAKTSDGSVRSLRAEDFGTDNKTISRWRTKLNDPDKFETTYAAACAKYPKLLEFISNPHVSQNSGDNEWYTPAEYLDAARLVMGGIDLDPASSETANSIVNAAKFYTAKDDGRAQEWAGRVWMNPPYAQPLVSEFSEKLASSVEAGTVSQSVVLVNNATETQWFQRMVSVSAAICFPLARIKFWSPSKDTAAPLQGQAFLYSGANVDQFCGVFTNFGFIAVVRR